MSHNSILLIQTPSKLGQTVSTENKAVESEVSKTQSFDRKAVGAQDLANVPVSHNA